MGVQCGAVWVTDWMDHGGIYYAEKEGRLRTVERVLNLQLFSIPLQGWNVSIPEFWSCLLPAANMSKNVSPSNIVYMAASHLDPT